MTENKTDTKVVWRRLSDHTKAILAEKCSDAPGSGGSRNRTAEASDVGVWNGSSRRLAAGGCSRETLQLRGGGGDKARE